MTAPESGLSIAVRRCAEQLGNGDLSALGQLYDLTAARLVRYAQSLTISREDAEDALQQAMVRLSRSPMLLARAEWPWSYCLRVVRNEALRILGGRQRSVELLADESVESTPVDFELDRQVRQNQIQSALGRLPAEQAEVVVLKIWEGLTLLQISEVIGESPNTVASRYRYAMEKLARWLRPIGEEVHHVEA